MRFFIVIIFVFNSTFGQDKYPSGYFQSPLDIPLSISGSFGELRPNHFHSGLDFRTEKREGLPIYASADGFISRIKISTGGYGKSIYIDHPNGYTTVYGHLQTCNPEIQAILEKEHYLKNSYEIEIFPKPDEIIVKKGDLIAYSGNSGSSGGPHLHFEIRDTKTEKIINPLFFGFDKNMKDTKPPTINSLIVYPLDEVSQINGSSKPSLINLIIQKDGTYLTEKIIASGKIAFGINAYDTFDEGYGKNGIFKLETYLNGNSYFGFEFDSFTFDETRYINAFIDFPRYQATRQRFQKLFVGYFYPENIIKTKKNDGIISLYSNFNLNYMVIVEDFSGNKTIINIPVIYSYLPIITKNEINKTPYFLKVKNENNYTKDNISVFIPEKTFYEDFYLKFDVKNNELFLHDDSVAVHENMNITFDVSSIPIDDREKMFIANGNIGKVNFNFTMKNDDLFSIKTKKLGRFFLAKDEVAPKIYKPNFIEGSNLDNQKTLQIHMSDNLSGISKYNGYLNGKWILLEYENKSNRLTHTLSDKYYQIGKNEFKLVVSDYLGNSTTFESNFIKTK